jgi:mitochondrial import inner membrane translocase subunit TIM22
MAYDTPYHTAGAGLPGAPGIPGAAAKDLTSLPLRRQIAIGFKDMGARSWSTAKNFGAVGALFSGIECGIEGLRAKNDLTNGVAAGCLTGGILARNGGPQAAAIGCAGFAAFSAAIDAWMRMPKDED